MLILLLDEWLPTGASLNIARNQSELDDVFMLDIQWFHVTDTRAAF